MELSPITGTAGPRPARCLNDPGGAAVDNSDNLYIADSGNSEIRKVTPAGVISIVAGNGGFGYSGTAG